MAALHADMYTKLLKRVSKSEKAERSALLLLWAYEYAYKISSMEVECRHDIECCQERAARTRLDQLQASEALSVALKVREASKKKEWCRLRALHEPHIAEMREEMLRATIAEHKEREAELRDLRQRYLDSDAKVRKALDNILYEGSRRRAAFSDGSSAVLRRSALRRKERPPTDSQSVISKLVNRRFVFPPFSPKKKKKR